LVEYATDPSHNSRKSNDPKIAVFYSKGIAYPESLLSEFTTALGNRGTIVGSFDLANMDTAWESKLQDVDFIALFPDGETQNSARLDNAIKLIKSTTQPILGSNTLYIQDVRSRVPEIAPCRLFIAVDWTPGQGDVDRNKIVTDTWGGDDNHRTALANDAATALWEALKQVKGPDVAGNTPTSINMRELLTKISFIGMTGNVQFAPNGDRKEVPTTRTYVTIVPGQNPPYVSLKQVQSQSLCSNNF